MLSYFSFGIEIVFCFVLVDFMLDDSVGAAAGGAILGVILLSLLTRKNDVKKQGGYGSVKVHKHTYWQQLQRPMEVLSMVRFKLGALGTSQDLAFGLDALELDAKDVGFCGTKLKEVSRSFATVITFLPSTNDAPLRLGVAVFYLVLRALDTVEDEMDLGLFEQYVLDEDVAGSTLDARLAAKQRLLRTFAQRLRDAISEHNGEASASQQPQQPQQPQQHHQVLGRLGEGCERELLEDLPTLLRVLAALPASMQETILDITEEMGVGMADYIARDLKNGTQNSEDFERYCHVAAGTVGDGLTRLFASCGYCHADLVERRDLWDAMGSFLQRTNIIRDYLEDLVDGRAWWPRTVWETYVEKDTVFGHAPSLSALADAASVDSGRSMHCLNHMIADALLMVPQCLEYLDNIADPAVLSFCALPQVIAIATLDECFNNKKVFQGVVKIRKGQAVDIMLQILPTSAAAANASPAPIRAAYQARFTQCLKSIASKAEPSVRQGDVQAQRVQDICNDLLDLIRNNTHAHAGANLAAPGPAGLADPAGAESDRQVRARTRTSSRAQVVAAQR